MEVGDVTTPNNDEVGFTEANRESSEEPARMENVDKADHVSIKVETYDWNDSSTNDNISDREFDSKIFPVIDVKRGGMNEVINEPPFQKREFEESRDRESRTISCISKKVKLSAEAVKTLFQSSLKANSMNSVTRIPKAGGSGEFEGSGAEQLEGDTESHPGEKLLLCELCDYRCSRAADMKRHMLVHTCEKPFSCELCDFRFSRAENLRTHMMIHTGEKPLSCDLCDYRCIRLANLKRHRRLHTGEKPFACDSCAYRCSRAENLRTHMMTHTGEKPLSCDFCDYRCIRPAHLKRHMMLHTGEKLLASATADDSCSVGERFAGMENVSTADSIIEPDDISIKIENECNNPSTLTKLESDSKNIEEDVNSDYVTRTETDEVKNEPTDQERQLEGICDSKSGMNSLASKPVRSSLPSDADITNTRSLKSNVETNSEDVVNRAERNPFPCDSSEFRENGAEHLKRHMKAHTGEKPIACEFCDYRCSHTVHLKRHMMVHTGEKPYACDLCDYTCRQPGNLQAHRRIHTGEKPYACDLCDYTCRQPGNLQVHRRIHTGEKPYACDLCNYTCCQRGNLQAHRKTHTGEKYFACGSCGHRFRRDEDLRTHMMTHTGEKPLSCDLCDCRYIRPAHLKRHMKIHTGEKPLACEPPDGSCSVEEHLAAMENVNTAGCIIKPDNLSVKIENGCNDVFTFANISNHDSDSKHFEEGDYITKTDTDEVSNKPPNEERQLEGNCDSNSGIIGLAFKAVKSSLPSDVKICESLTLNVETSSMDVINCAERNPFPCVSSDFSGGGAEHVEKQESHVGEKPFVCQFCDYRGSQAAYLRKHMKTHTGQKPYACDLCDYRCSKAEHLASHLRIHTGEKPYACDSCDYRFSQSVHLKRHMRIHTGEKPFACDACDYKCSHASRLKRHMMVHTGEKPYACNLCDYTCRQPGNLQAHMRTHTGEKPFTCDLCGYRCNQAATLKNHMRIHTGEKPFVCDLCGYRFNQAATLKKHMGTHRDDEPIASESLDSKCSIEGNSTEMEAKHTAGPDVECDTVSIRIDYE